MPLPLPKLDDRRWNDLVDEGRALIPRYAPTWTDHNVHDPGITLLELFAWLAEMTIYRLDRVTETHRRKFLELIGYDPLPPRAARCTLTFKPDATTASFVLPSGVEFDAIDSDGQTIHFRTLRDVTVAVVELSAVQVEELDESGVRTLRDRTREWRDDLPIELFSLNAPRAVALYLGFTILPPDLPIALAFRFEGPRVDHGERSRIAAEAAAQRAACVPPLPDIDCGRDNQQTVEAADAVLLHHSASLVWEVYTGNAPDTWTSLKPIFNGELPGVGEARDDTRSFSLHGTVEINVPNTRVATTLGEVSQALFYVRCRLKAGAHDAPPVLLDIAPVSVETEQAIPMTESLTIAAGVTPGGPAPVPGSTSRFNTEIGADGVIQALEFEPANTSAPRVVILAYEAPTATATGRVTWEITVAGRCSGVPHQRMFLRPTVQVETLALYTHVDQQWETWTPRNSFDGSRRTDLHFVLDAMTGEIRFGDGERGRAPPAGSLVFATYRTTRADKGNVPAGRVTHLADSARNTLWLSAFPPAVREQLRTVLSNITTNRAAASGGATVESLAAATGRAIEAVHAHERLLEIAGEAKSQTLDQLDPIEVSALRPPGRAVNLFDIDRLALDVPGTRVARARAWDSTHPAYPCLTAPGVITVVIVPDQPVDEPQPMPGLLAAVWRYLNRRRVITTRIEVTGPQYLEVRIQASVRIKALADAASVRERILSALDRFLDPRHGGPNGRGWPFGRNVYRSEILQLIDAVPGVDHVVTLTLTGGTGEPSCGNVALCPTWLVSPGVHQIAVERGTG